MTLIDHFGAIRFEHIVCKVYNHSLLHLKLMLRLVFFMVCNLLY